MDLEACTSGHVTLVSLPILTIAVPYLIKPLSSHFKDHSWQYNITGSLLTSFRINVLSLLLLSGLHCSFCSQIVNYFWMTRFRLLFLKHFVEEKQFDHQKFFIKDFSRSLQNIFWKTSYYWNWMPQILFRQCYIHCHFYHMAAFQTIGNSLWIVSMGHCHIQIL